MFLFIDGWTLDQKLTKITPVAELMYPAVGSSCEIIVSHIVSIEEFYAHIPSMSLKSIPSLKEVQLKMNSFNIKSKYIPFNVPPGRRFVNLIYCNYLVNN